MWRVSHLAAIKASLAAQSSPGQEGKIMTTMISEVYRAFVKAGVLEQDAMQAAEALSAENLATKKDIDEARLDIHRHDNKKMAVMQWMLGIVIAAQVLPLFQAVAAIL